MDVTRKNFLRLMVYVSAATALGCGDDTTNTKDSTDPGTDPGSDSGTDPTDTTDTTDPGSDTTDPGSDTTDTVTGTGPFTCMDTISGNHGHEIVVLDEEIVAGVEKVYDIKGSSPHTHTITLTPADFADLAAGKTVVKVSTPSPHTHDVTIRCMQ